MNKVILQFWEESERDWGVRSDGCSVHVNLEYNREYINDCYEKRGDVVPDEYDRAYGEPIDAFIDDELFELVKKNKSIRLFQTQLNNLLKLEQIIIKNE